MSPRPVYFPVPGYWNGHDGGNGPLSGAGYATFRLRVRLPAETSPLSIRIEDQSTAYRLWVNGIEVMSDGVVSMAADTGKPSYRIGTAALPAAGEVLDFVLQVSNFHLAKGGPYRPIVLGTAADIEKRQHLLFAADLLLFSMLVVIGIYHLVFYLLRREDPSLLYFGLFCLCWSAGIPFGSLGGRFMTLVFPDFPWYWQCRMELLTWFPTVPLFLMFFGSLFPQEFSSRVARLSQLVAALFFSYAALVPSRLVSLTEVPYQIFSLGIGGYICLSLNRAVKNRRSEAALMLAGFLVFLAAVINDILYMNLLIRSVYLISVGIAIMILFQAFALAIRIARSFSAVEARKQSERKLRVLQRQLSSMLDNIDEAILAVNESEEITFCNHAGEILLGHSAEKLLGRPFREVMGLFPDGPCPVAAEEAIRGLFRSGGNCLLGMAALPDSGGGCGRAGVYLSFLDVEEDPVCLIILRKIASVSDLDAKDIPQTLAVVEALNQNRARLQSIQSSLHCLWPLSMELRPEFMQELSVIDEALDNVSKTLMNLEKFESKRHLAVEVMNCSLNYWTRCTGLTKVDLARQSGLWSIYTNQDGWERTQTLDRYLHIETFPRRPLWNKVLKTAGFVLATGTNPSPLRTRLEVLLTQLRLRK
ncbi:MAG: 7TM diverse intracellular signaling domain-containing protein [Syntrophotaleaceae bacterium]